MSKHPTTKAAIRAWLVDYAWLSSHTDAQKEAEVDCIMAQDDWRHIEARVERLRAQASGEEVDLDGQAWGYALSGLYECHDEPHLPTCPYYKD